jgi:signal transduction histidine kinase
MKSSSLFRRAISTVLLIELLCALAFVWTAVWHERRIRLRALDVVLTGRADSLIGAVQDAEDPEDTVKVDPAEFNPPSTDVYAVFSEPGQLVGVSSNAPPAIISRLRNGFRDTSADNHEYRVLQREAVRIIDREQTGGAGIRRPVTVIYAIQSDHLWHEVLEAASFYVLMSLGLLSVTALALVILLRRLLEPIQELAFEAACIKIHSLSFSPPPSAMRVRELAPLAQALSATIARLRIAFEAEHRFITDAAHELKTAVAVVRSSIQVLGMRVRSADEYRRGLDQVLSDNERVEELVSKMLTLSGFEERSGLPPEQIDLSQHVELTLKNLASFAEMRGVILRSSLERGMRVNLAPEAAEILASNLIMNALQHSPNASEVIVSVRSRRSGERRALLVVQDFGTGIAPQNLSRIFDRFFREDPSRSRETGGFGLGLAICKNIVEAAGGEIRVQSVLDQGTVATVSLRLS